MARDTVQADRLEAVLSGELGPEDVSTDLAELASLASSLHEEIELEAPSDVFRARLRNELLAAEKAPSLLTRVQDRVAEGTARLRRSLRVAGATAMASTLIGTTGVAAAAQTALPGDLLYGIKGATEDVRMLFASDGVERGRLHLAFARERLEEVEDGVDRLSPSEFESALVAFDEEAAAGANLLLGETPSPQVRGELTAFTSEVRRRLLDLSLQLPLSVRPATENSLEVLRRIDLQLQGLIDASACARCGDTAEQFLPRVVLPGDGPAQAPGCQCVEGTDGSDTEDTAADDPATDQPDTAPSLDGELDAPQDSSGGLSSNLSGTGDLVDDLLDEGGDVVDDTTDQLGDTIEDTGDQLGDTVEDTSSELGDTVGDVTETLDDAIDETSSSVDDTVDDVGSTVDGTLDEGGDLLDGS